MAKPRNIPAFDFQLPGKVLEIPVGINLLENGQRYLAYIRKYEELKNQ